MALQPLHFDKDDTFLAQAVGTKCAIVLPRGDASWEKLRAYPYSHPMTRRSQLANEPRWNHDLSKFDGGLTGWKRLPRGVQLAVVPPGAVLFNPAFWWHEVASIQEQSVGTASQLSVSFRFYELPAGPFDGREYAAEKCEGRIRNSHDAVQTAELLSTLGRAFTLPLEERTKGMQDAVRRAEELCSKESVLQAALHDRETVGEYMAAYFKQRFDLPQVCTRACTNSRDASRAIASNGLTHRSLMVCTRSTLNKNQASHMYKNGTTTCKSGKKMRGKAKASTVTNNFERSI